MDRRHLEEHVRTLITLDETPQPFLSAYLDLRDPLALHKLKEQARRIRMTLPREQRPAFELALGRIEGSAERLKEQPIQSAAIFCREGDDPFFLSLKFRVELPTELSYDTLPHVFRLIELKDSYDRYVVLIVSEEEARILEISLGEVTRQVWTERAALRDRVGREWTRRHYQNHRRHRTEAFYKEVLEILERRVLAGGFAHLVIAGNAQAIGLLRPRLSKQLESRVVEILSHAKRQSPTDVVRSTIGSFVEREQLETLATVRQLREEIRKGGLAVVGRDSTRDALEAGAVDVLLLSADWEDHFDEREQLVRQAERSGAEIEVVQNEELLEAYEGVGALLRFPFSPALTLTTT